MRLILPYRENVVDALVFDPPFTAQYDETEWFTRERFDSDRSVDIDSQEDIIELYHDTGREAYRVLRQGGFLIVKVQDVAHNGRQYFMHDEVVAGYQETGFELKDRFILIREDIPATPLIKNQRHARKTIHSS